MNPKIAEALGMRVVEEGVVSEPEILPVVIEPHDIVPVDNPDLPEMQDIDRRMLEGETQLEEVISTAKAFVQDLKSTINQTDPRYRGRMVEVTATVINQWKDAVIHKTKLQLDKKEMRLKEAEFKRSGGKGGIITEGPAQTTNHIYVGTREEFLESIEELNDDDSE